MNSDQPCHVSLRAKKKDRGHRYRAEHGTIFVCCLIARYYYGNTGRSCLQAQDGRAPPHPQAMTTGEKFSSLRPSPRLGTRASTLPRPRDVSAPDSNDIRRDLSRMLPSDVSRKAA
jgi:hypothetical protein